MDYTTSMFNTSMCNRKTGVTKRFSMHVVQEHLPLVYSDVCRQMFSLLADRV